MLSVANLGHLLQSFRHNEYYRLVVKVHEDNARASSISPSLNRGPNRGSRHGSDAKAVFVGGLPETVTEEQLQEAFRAYGVIVECKIIRKALGGKSRIRLCFNFY